MRSRSILGYSGLAGLIAISAVGCLERPVAHQAPHSTAMVVEPLKLSAVERIDLLLAIDNSSSMGDKQEILARAVPDLVKRLANPRCVDNTGKPVGSQPDSPTAGCPAGSERELLAVPDIHIGIVSSSLGGVAGGICGKAKDNDHGQLLSRTKAGGSLSTYEDHGFLAWDPDKKLDPAGESVLDDGATGLVPTLQEMVRGVGESGCGFEASLESWYRFLVDPEPYLALKQQGEKLVPWGRDDTVLDQRRAFLRPDSLVAIVMLTDENDCSVAPGEGAARLYSAENMVRPRSECAMNPDDVCCAPCDAAPPGCKPEAACTDESGNVARLSDTDDDIDLRCFDQKRRFGKSYLHPLERYTKGLTDLQIETRSGEMKPNPLFVDLNPDDDIRGTRNPGLVFLTGIVGVPWQDIARDPTNLAKGLKNAKEMNVRDAAGRSAWDVILGDGKGGPPLDPHMIETTKERPGTNPITGTDMAPSSAGPNADPISGHEQPEQTDNLQYACIFPLLAPIECFGQSGCGCNKPEGNPLCQDAAGAYSKTQLYGKAYPGVRELGVLQGMGEQAIVASVCPANMVEATEDDTEDFGYRPAIGALIERLKGKLGYQCLPRKLTPEENGQVSCLVLEARKSESCSCKASDGRMAVEEDHGAAIQGARDSGIIDENNDCFCEIPQLDDEELTACQNEKLDPMLVDGEQVDGWCYVDATSVPPVGEPALVPESCASTERRLVRLVGNAKARPGSTLFIMCSEG